MKPDQNRLTTSDDLGFWALHLPQVVRRQRLEATHPDVVIRPPGKHSMLYVAEVPGVREVTSFDLRPLLDKLDQLFAA